MNTNPKRAMVAEGTSEKITQNSNVKKVMKTATLKVVRMAFSAMICGVMFISCGGGGGNQPNKKPNDKVVCGDKTYTFRVGEIISDKETNTTTIKLLTDGQRISFTFSASNLFGGTIPQPVSPIKMKIAVGNRIIECNNEIGYTSDEISFSFNTLNKPDKRRLSCCFSISKS